MIPFRGESLKRYEGGFYRVLTVAIKKRFVCPAVWQRRIPSLDTYKGAWATGCLSAMVKPVFHCLRQVNKAVLRSMSNGRWAAERLFGRRCVDNYTTTYTPGYCYSDRSCGRLMCLSLYNLKMGWKIYSILAQ